MRYTNFRLSKLINALKGQSLTIQEALDDLYPEMSTEEMTLEEHADLKTKIFLCKDCGAWLSVEERPESDTSSNYCKDCLSNADDFNGREGEEDDDD